MFYICQVRRQQEYKRHFLYICRRQKVTPNIIIVRFVKTKPSIWCPLINFHVRLATALCNGLFTCGTKPSRHDCIYFHTYWLKTHVRVQRTYLFLRGFLSFASLGFEDNRRSDCSIGFSMTRFQEIKCVSDIWLCGIFFMGRLMTKPYVRIVCIRNNGLGDECWIIFRYSFDGGICCFIFNDQIVEYDIISE